MNAEVGLACRDSFRHRVNGDRLLDGQMARCGGEGQGIVIQVQGFDLQDLVALKREVVGELECGATQVAGPARFLELTSDFND